MADRPEDNGASAQERGYMARDGISETPVGVSGVDQTLTNERFMNTQGASVVMENEQRYRAETDAAIGSYRNVLESSDILDMNDLVSGLDPRKVRGIMGNGIQNLAGQVATDLVQQGMTSRIPNEATMMSESHSMQPRTTGGDWGVEKMFARLRSGKQVPVWKVTNEATGMGIERPFRIQEPAQRVASILNQTGNVNDQRIVSVMEAYDTHIELMKQMRGLKRQLKESTRKGPIKQRIAEIRDELEEVNYKLGI